MKIENIEEAAMLSRTLASFQKLIDDEIFVTPCVTKTLSASVHVEYTPRRNVAQSVNLDMDQGELRRFVENRIKEIKRKLVLLGVYIEEKEE